MSDTFQYMNRMAFASLLVDNNIPIRQQTAEEVMAGTASLEDLLGTDNRQQTTDNRQFSLCQVPNK